jgi:hypothetical protein
MSPGVMTHQSALQELSGSHGDDDYEQVFGIHSG